MQGDKYDAIWQNIWNLVKTYDNIDASQIDAFFSRLQLQAFSEGFVMLTADTDFIKTWIESHYTDVIKQALEDTYHVPFNIAIAVDESSSTKIPQAPAQPVVQQPVMPSAPAVQVPLAPPEPAPVPQTGNGQSIVSGYSFESFVRGTSNQMAYSMALAVAETPGKRELNP